MTETSIIEALARYRAERNRREDMAPAELTDAEADKLMVELVSHTLEELVELRLCLNRKRWKVLPSIRGKSEESLALRANALEELADVILMLQAFADIACITFDEVATALRYKMHKNLNRQDHSCNEGHLQ
jgi:NTP pyrophosphatase (non-canonical NTP hydrolase)